MQHHRLSMLNCSVSHIETNAFLETKLGFVGKLATLTSS